MKLCHDCLKYYIKMPFVQINNIDIPPWLHCHCEEEKKIIPCEMESSYDSHIVQMYTLHHFKFCPYCGRKLA